MTTDDTTTTLRKRNAINKPSAASRTIPMALGNESGRPDVIARSVADLDRAVAAVREISATTAAAYWSVGATLADVHDRKLWKLRVDGDGKAQFTGFDAWARAELGVSSDQAANMIAVARAFTVEQVKAYGRSKLELVTRMPKQLHERLLADIANGASYRDIKAEVQKYKSETDFIRGDDNDAKKGKRTQTATKARLEAHARTAAAKAAIAARPADRIDIATIAGRQTIKVYERPASLEGVAVKDLKRAKTITSGQTFARLELANEVVMHFFPHLTAQGWTLVVHTGRAEPVK